MCGINGFYNIDLGKDRLLQMTNTLAHRGPDHEDIYLNPDKKVGLGHSRLSILDLSTNANQPLYSHNKRYIIVFNGEIYNFKSIAKELDIQFNTSSDTEVILEAFSIWGTDFVKKLNGMFAISIYDTLEDKLYLFRDRMGIKPLFYFHKDHQFIFASELKAFSVLKEIVSLDINNKAIYNFLHLGYIPDNDTIYQNIFKLPAGSYAAVSKNNVAITPYWSIEQCFDKNIITNEQEAKNLLDTAINNSVSARLISDVPIGTFLSGGIDSSLVSAVASKHYTGKLNTFSIGFKESKHNESKYARAVANHLGTNHHEFMLSENDAKEQLEHVIECYDQPFADSSALPTFLVSKMAKKHVTVALSGDGGDELFMGYGAYNWRKRLDNLIVWNTRKLVSKGLLMSGSDKYKRGALVLNAPSTNTASHIFSQEQYLFSESELASVLKTTSSITISDQHETIRKLSKIENQALFDIKNYLKDDLLVKVDIASMMNSLEVRVPLLDHNVVTLALNIDEKLKFHPNGTQKHLLKEVLYQYVPKKLFDRPKWGFSIPLSTWLKTDLHFLIDKYLNDNILKELDIYNRKQVNKLINRFENGDTYLYNRVWAMIVLNKFLLKHKA